MTKHEQVVIAAGRKWGSGTRAQVKFIQKRLEVIEHLLQEPELEAVSITKLVVRCNQLEIENRELRQILTQRQDIYNQLRKQVGTLQVTVAKTKALLRASNKKLTQFRVGPRSTEQSRRVKYLEQARAADDAYIRKLRAEIEGDPR